MRIVVLGAGRVGAAITKDLARDDAFTVAAVDLSEKRLASLQDIQGLEGIRADLSKESEVSRVVGGADLVVGAVPGHMGFHTLETVLSQGKPVVDISFFEEDPFELDELAKEKGVTAVVDCGVAPGCGNIIAGYMETTLDKVERFDLMVGGLPSARNWPYEYKAVFSPSDVIEEYVRPARYVRDGKIVTVPALSEPELVDFRGVGTLEAFNTDGLRTLLKTMSAENRREKTLRYPGHVQKMRMLRESGFFSKEPVEVGGVWVRPLDVTAKLLFPMWRLFEGDEDLTVMRVTVEGTKGGRTIRHDYNLLDRYDPATGTTSMARTTGYTCTAVVRLVAKGLFDRPGISPPEYIGRTPDCYLFVMQELAKRGVIFKETVT